MVWSAPAAQVAGYPIVRVLARDARATLLLAHHGEQPRVLRIAAHDGDAAQLDREIDARARAAGEHAATVLDLATSDSGAPVVVLEHLAGPRLDDLLERRRGALSAGEAVTLIVPVLEAVAAAHDRGLTFGGLTAEGIRLRSDGAPVITRFSAARAGAVLPAHFRGRAAEYRVDLDSALSLAVAIASQVASPSRGALTAVLAGDHPVDRDPGFASTIAALFDCAEPTPVRTAAGTTLARDTGQRDCDALDTPGSGPGAVWESDPLEPDADQLEVARSPQERGRLAPLLRRLALPDSLVQTVLEGETRLAALGAAVRVRPTHGVKPRTLALGAAGAISALLALLLVGAGGSQEGAGGTGGPSPSPSPPTAPLALPEGPTPTRNGTGDAPERHGAPQPEQWVDVVGDLVERWLRCRERAAAGACAHESVQPGSSAEVAFHAPEEATALVLRRWSGSARDLVVVERMGAAVIVDLLGQETTTASLLLMRNEAGWRLRDVLVEPSGG